MYRRWMGEPGCPTAFTGHRDIAAKGTGPSRNPGRSSATRRKSDPAGQRIDNRSHGDHRDLSHTALHRSSGRQATGLRANVGRGFDLSARPDRRSLHPIDRCPISRRNLSRSFRALPDRRVLPFHVNRLGILPIPSGKTPTLTLDHRGTVLSLARGLDRPGCRTSFHPATAELVTSRRLPGNRTREQTEQSPGRRATASKQLVPIAPKTLSFRNRSISGVPLSRSGGPLSSAPPVSACHHPLRTPDHRPEADIDEA